MRESMQQFRDTIYHLKADNSDLKERIQLQKADFEAEIDELKQQETIDYKYIVADEVASPKSRNSTQKLWTAQQTAELPLMVPLGKTQYRSVTDRISTQTPQFTSRTSQRSAREVTLRKEISTLDNEILDLQTMLTQALNP